MSDWRNWQTAFLQLQKTPQGIQLLKYLEIFILRFEEFFI
jgi:hypothetical protein